MRITKVELFHFEQPVYKYLTKKYGNDFEATVSVVMKRLGAEKFASALNKSPPSPLFSHNCNEQETSLDQAAGIVTAGEQIAKLNGEIMFEQTNQTVSSSLATSQ